MEHQVSLLEHKLESLQRGHTRMAAEVEAQAHGTPCSSSWLQEYLMQGARGGRGTTRLVAPTHVVDSGLHPRDPDRQPCLHLCSNPTRHAGCASTQKYGYKLSRVSSGTGEAQEQTGRKPVYGDHAQCKDATMRSAYADVARGKECSCPSWRTAQASSTRSLHHPKPSFYQRSLQHTRRGFFCVRQRKGQWPHRCRLHRVCRTLHRRPVVCCTSAQLP